MSIADLSNVLKLVGGGDGDTEQQQALYEEVLLMVLARASSSDASIQAIEIASIQEIIKKETGTDLTDQDVRKAARTELYESTPLRKYLGRAQRKMRDADRAKVVALLADVIRSDTEISVLEIDFFNMVANSLKATPAEIAGL